MAYEPRTFQNTTTNTPPTGTDPMVDNTANGDVQAVKLLDPTPGSTTPLIGQQARTGSMPIALSTEDAALLAGLLTTTAFGAAGLATAANQSTLNTRAGDLTEAAPATDTASSGLNGRLQRIAQRLTSLIALLPASLGQKTMANSLPVVLASDQAAIPVTLTSTTVTGTVTTKETRAATSSVTSVADTASSTTLLASNANRLGATIHNDSTVALYLKLGATASTTSFTVKMAADSYYEVPANYTGIIDGIWASDASGSARITELSA